MLPDDESHFVVPASPPKPETASQESTAPAGDTPETETETPPSHCSGGAAAAAAFTEDPDAAPVQNAVSTLVLPADVPARRSEQPRRGAAAPATRATAPQPPTNPLTRRSRSSGEDCGPRPFVAFLAPVPSLDAAPGAGAAPPADPVLTLRPSPAAVAMMPLPPVFLSRTLDTVHASLPRVPDDAFPGVCGSHCVPGEHEIY